MRRAGSATRFGKKRITMVRFQRVSHTFGKAWALRDVTFAIAKGDFLFITGPSGAGKTTLLRLMYAALPLMRGQAAVAGYDLASLARHRVPDLRRQIGVVFQDFKILPRRTVFDNVALALEVRGMARQVIERRVRAVLRVLEIEDKIHEPCERLSGGEQQRVAIARSMVVNPQLILADEPTGNLDPTLSTRLMEVFKQFYSFGATVIVATHSREMLQCKRDAKILHLVDGCVAGANFEAAAPGPGWEAP
jgi:cell division transport system ATP-binding protein